MPPRKAVSTTCSHRHLQLEPSAYANEAGFEWLPAASRIAAETKSGRKAPRDRSNNASTDQLADARLSSFPGPLVYPWDELGYDPEPDLQSFKSWHQERHRNKPTQARKTLYVMDVPETSKEVDFMHAWARPQHVADNKQSCAAAGLDAGTSQGYVDYVAAFYHGFPTRMFPNRLRFVPWVEGPTKSKKKKPTQQQYVGLATADGNTTRIRARNSPDGVFSHQLNLEDILDAAIAMLPDDAYAIMLLMDHDLYEDEDDDFCCGRAYGGSRVSVVSTARYRPELDEQAKIDTDHMWPASHCKSYAAKLCAEQDIHNATRNVPSAANSPMRAALAAASRVKYNSGAGYLRAEWFSRVARTVTHELGHCFCLAHCAYYACLMQSTSGMAEDVRTPPYLCAVCLSKLSYAAAVELRGGDEDSRLTYLKQRYSAIESLLPPWNIVGMFAGFSGWANARRRTLFE
jgi:archaemetzincin